MLKRYATDKSVQWVGKAWEIRGALRQTQKQNGGNARLVDLLAPASFPRKEGARP